MGVAIGADQRPDFHAIAADIADEIREDREAGDDLDLVLALVLCARRGRGEREQCG